ncbi:aminotransferase class I/II-fold pyridoxal phosphate-dependent enzyme [Paenibacillus sp. sptzw28]|uniref:aminotransferase class I/II-fold pyridoxal phosphate-dependent enzyme n=1 Tax=Paenibacillus sp. sptzw28 TaxID=715179 RepID=UPI001C6EEC86|nr:aminotransferase class I/II-fold pyridoxal phosphate-dependent enzyme [Paenibacillus sp. sptzw28]QYR21855.1 aminotransferase class I/II-fold pyridoxal phosphate-dependent enzyme [Paenibacillus sp. sptzw28]
MMNQRRAPLFEELKALYEKQPASFHVPGHKSGQGLDDPMELNFFQQVMSIDFGTGILGLDRLHDPKGSVKVAQELAAACFGADQSFFLVGGSSIGNLALLLSVCRNNEPIIVQRNVHKSVIHGLMLAGARAVFLPSRWDKHNGVAYGVRLEDVEAALKQYPDAKGVFLSNPNYYGMGIDLRPFAKLVHAYNKPLLVDEAHGAHYGFHPSVPASALSSGADAVIQSTHKMLTAMSSGSMLHVQGNLLDRDLIAQRLSMLHTTSPFYPILASLDLSRRQMALEGRQRLSAGLRTVEKFRSSLRREMPWFRLIGDADDPFDYETLDPFKISIKDGTGTLTGFQLEAELAQQGCIVEMADLQYALAVFSLASTEKDADRLLSALENISLRYGLEKKSYHDGGLSNSMFDFSPFTEISETSVIRLQQNDTVTVPLEEALHAQAGEMVIPFPPGVPLIYPGERINSQVIQTIRMLSAAGARFSGVQDDSMRTVRILSPVNERLVRIK